MRFPRTSSPDLRGERAESRRVDLEGLVVVKQHGVHPVVEVLVHALDGVDSVQTAVTAATQYIVTSRVTRIFTRATLIASDEFVVSTSYCASVLGTAINLSR